MRHAERANVEIPVRRAVDLLVERRELPEIESVMHRVYLAQQRQQGVVGHFFEVLGAQASRVNRIFWLVTQLG